MKKRSLQKLVLHPLHPLPRQRNLIKKALTLELTTLGQREEVFEEEVEAVEEVPQKMNKTRRRIKVTVEEVGVVLLEVAKVPASVEKLTINVLSAKKTMQPLNVLHGQMKAA